MAPPSPKPELGPAHTQSGTRPPTSRTEDGHGAPCAREQWWHRVTWACCLEQEALRVDKLRHHWHAGCHTEEQG